MMGGFLGVLWHVGAHMTVAATCLCAMSWTAAAAESPAGSRPESLERLVAAWQRRQATVRTFRLEWTTTRTDIAGSFTRTLKLTTGDDSTQPPQDISYEILHEFVLDRIRMRSTYEGAVWNASRQCLERIRTTMVTDGTECQTLDEELDSGGPPQSVVAAHRDSPFEFDFAFMPLYLHLQPFEPGLGRLRPERLRLVKQPATERELVVETETRNTPFRLHVDPARDYIITRIMVLRPSGSEKFHVELSYAHDPVAGWMPTGWHQIVLDRDAQLKMSIGGAVTRREVNGAVRAEEFELTLPPGTKLIDDRGNSQTVVVAESGRWTAWWGLVVGMAGAVLVGYLLLRRRLG